MSKYSWWRRVRSFAGICSSQPTVDKLLDGKDVSSALSPEIVIIGSRGETGSIAQSNAEPGELPSALAKLTQLPRLSGMGIAAVCISNVVDAGPFNTSSVPIDMPGERVNAEGIDGTCGCRGPNGPTTSRFNIVGDEKISAGVAMAEFDGRARRASALASRSCNCWI